MSEHVAETESSVGKIAVPAEVIPCALFVRGRFGVGGLRGTPLEVWSRWLLQQHGVESHTVTEWNAIITAHGNTSAYRDLSAHSRKG